MTKKKINIVLILVVLALWGTVGYRALYRKFSNNEIIFEKQKKNDNATINQINKDTFELKKMNRDPFLNKQFHPAIVIPKMIISYNKTVKKVTIPHIIKGDPTLRWPSLSYYGYIGSKEKNEDLFLLKIDAKLYKLKLNNPVNGLIVKKRFKDSIEVYFNSETKIVRLK